MRVPNKPFLTVAEAALAIGVCKASVHHYLKLGYLPCDKPSPRLTLIPRAAVLKFRRPPRGNPAIADLRRRKR